MPKYIRLRDIPQEYGVSRITVWRWSRGQKHGFPPAIRLSPRITVYDVEEVNAWFSKNRARAT
ncbi:helix-turn-helix transcriptional regulator [Govanella unica]|uniref:helix-turn-helix transcriptional regulator n=1 Tax=Govanella unica TaxID=2975056 RepID=UPI003D1BA77A